jgi:hypothetical protein
MEDNATMRDAFEAAFDEVEDNTPEIAADEPEISGELADAVSEETTEETAEEAVSGEVAEAAPDTDAPADEPRTKSSSPPVSWGVTNKQEWDKLPNGVREEITAREQQVNQLFQQTADDRRTATQFNQLVTAYAPVIAAEGVQNPIEAIQGLMNITATLQQGGPQQKAERVAGLIKHYGIDIGMLDNVLAGEPVADPQQQQFSQMLDQRLAPVNQLLEQFNQTKQQQEFQTQQEAGQTVEQFGADPKNEFFHDVREVMADFLDMAAQRGQNMSLEQAYDRACALNPEIANIVASKRAQELQATSQANMAGKRNAASSVAGRSAAAGGGKGDMSVHDLISTLWDEQTG